MLCVKSVPQYLNTPCAPVGCGGSEGLRPLPTAPTIQCSITCCRTWATTTYSYFLLLFVSLVISILDPIQQFTILARSCQLQSLVILSFYKADEMELNGIGGRCWNWWNLLRWVEFIVFWGAYFGGIQADF